MYNITKLTSFIYFITSAECIYQGYVGRRGVARGLWPDFPLLERFIKWGVVFGKFLETTQNPVLLVLWNSPKSEGFWLANKVVYSPFPLFPFPSSKVIYPFILFPSHIPTLEQSLKTKTKTKGQINCRGQCNTHATPINLKANHVLSATQHSSSKHTK